MPDVGRGGAEPGVQGPEVENDPVNLKDSDPQRWEALVSVFGDELLEYLKYQPAHSLTEVENALYNERKRIKKRVGDLFESIDPNTPITDWTFEHIQKSENGTVVITTDVFGPNGTVGYFERAYDPTSKQLELRYAFLRLSGMSIGLPNWVRGGDVFMVEGKGTPTVQYVTFCQMKLLRAATGQTEIAKVKMCSIQNIETVLHLHWLRKRHPEVSNDDLIGHTASVKYAETTMIQSGYQITGGIRYVSDNASARPIGELMKFQEGGDLTRIRENDGLLERFGFTRDTVMEQNFDIELDVLEA